jgi:hypothetical protein
MQLWCSGHAGAVRAKHGSCSWAIPAVADDRDRIRNAPSLVAVFLAERVRGDSEVLILERCRRWC